MHDNAIGGACGWTFHLERRQAHADGEQMHE